MLNAKFNQPVIGFESTRGAQRQFVADCCVDTPSSTVELNMFNKVNSDFIDRGGEDDDDD